MSATTHERPTRPAEAAGPYGGVVHIDVLDGAEREPVQLAELGGAGGAAKFSDSGGTVLQVTQLQLIYWGSAWTATPAPTPTSDAITAACRTMMASSYMTGLAEYRGIGRGFVRGETVVTKTSPSNGFTDNQVSTFVDGLITAGPCRDQTSTTRRCTASSCPKVSTPATRASSASAATTPVPAARTSISRGSPTPATWPR
jgi:hypothetical protein